MVSSFTPAGTAGADDADIIAPFGMHDNQQSLPVGMAEDNGAGLGLRVDGVGNLRTLTNLYRIANLQGIPEP